MIPKAKLDYDQDYKILRRKFLGKKYPFGLNAVKAWIQMKGADTIKAAEKEIRTDEKLKRQLSRLSDYEVAYMKLLHESEPYDGELQ